jgi:acyl-CoA thioesterase
MTPKQRAQKVAEAMLANDKASGLIGLRLIDIDEGHAEMALNVEPHHTNGHGICHGGITYTLADTAFALACNSRNQSTLSMHNIISYMAPGHVGDTLTARASEVTLTGRNGIYDVKVTNQNNDLIAEFRGMSRAIRGKMFDE